MRSSGVRRAAQAAGAAENEERALELARDAADPVRVSRRPETSRTGGTISDHPTAEADIDDLLASAPNEPLYYTPGAALCRPLTPTTMTAKTW